MIPVFSIATIEGTYGRKKINRNVISKEVYENYVKPLKQRMADEEDQFRLSILKCKYSELYGDFIVEGAPLYVKLTTLKKDEDGKLIKCTLTKLGPYTERL